MCNTVRILILYIRRCVYVCMCVYLYVYMCVYVKKNYHLPRSQCMIQIKQKNQNTKKNKK